MITLQFDAASGELQHRAASGSGFIPIGSYAEFQLISSGYGTFMDGKYKQEANLDLLGDQNGDGTFDPIVDQNWAPVSNYICNDFTGTFDGNGKDIANLYIDSNDYFVGLFAFGPGKIKNVHIRSGSVTGDETVGGIAGACDGGGTIENCSNAATVRGNKLVGGIVGYNVGNIIACSNTGLVIGSIEEVGGIAGRTIGSITACSNTGQIEAYRIVGGIAGSIDGGRLTACYNVGPVYVLYVPNGDGGSLVGKVEANGCSQIACYWLPGGNVSDAMGNGSYFPPEFDSTHWPLGNSDTEPAWRIGNADGSGSGHYWKSMGTPSDSPGPNDFPRLWWE
jgi:hypothetical protein